MNRVKHLIIAMIFIVFVIGVLTTPVSAETTTCTQKSLIGLSLILPLMLIGSLITVIDGAGFTLVSAKNTDDDKYVKKRKRTIIYCCGLILIIYGSNALLSVFDLGFGCFLPLV